VRQFRNSDPEFAFGFHRCDVVPTRRQRRGPGEMPGHDQYHVIVRKSGRQELQPLAPYRRLRILLRRHNSTTPLPWVGYIMGYRRRHRVNLTFKVNYLRETCDSDPNLWSPNCSQLGSTENPCRVDHIEDDGGCHFLGQSTMPLEIEWPEPLICLFSHARSSIKTFRLDSKRLCSCPGLHEVIRATVACRELASIERLAVRPATAVRNP
jgi:hypothetical protein